VSTSAGDIAEKIDIYMKMRRSDISSVDLVSLMSEVCLLHVQAVEADE
jgi:hypothetical protein